MILTKYYFLIFLFLFNCYESKQKLSPLRSPLAAFIIGFRSSTLQFESKDLPGTAKVVRQFGDKIYALIESPNDPNKLTLYSSSNGIDFSLESATQIDILGNLFFISDSSKLYVNNFKSNFQNTYDMSEFNLSTKLWTTTNNYGININGGANPQFYCLNYFQNKFQSINSDGTSTYSFEVDINDPITNISLTTLSPLANRRDYSCAQTNDTIFLGGGYRSLGGGSPLTDLWSSSNGVDFNRINSTDISSLTNSISYDFIVKIENGDLIHIGIISSLKRSKDNGVTWTSSNISSSFQFTGGVIPNPAGLAAIKNTVYNYTGSKVYYGVIPN